MKIGILTRNLISETKDKTTGIPNTYLNVVNKNNFPIFINNQLELTEKNKLQLLNQIKDIDGFILPGGENVSKVDLFIIDHCYKNNIPLLGICLGMQEIGYYFNSKTIKKLPTNSHFKPKDDYVHKIKLTNKGYLHNLLKCDSLFVNSRHNYHIQKNKNYIIEAKCDKVIEAIKVKNTKYILGVQFHPEIMATYDNNAKKILEDFLKVCSLNNI